MLNKLFSRALLPALSAILLSLMLSNMATAQTATYHLHKEASSTSGLDQLKAAGPDGASMALLSSNLQNAAVGEYLIQGFDTQSGVPNAGGVIPSGSTLTAPARPGCPPASVFSTTCWTRLPATA